MFGHRNVTRNLWRAVVVAGAMWGSSVGCASTPRQPTAEPTAVPAEEVPAEEATGAKREEGTGSALGESTPPPAGAQADAGAPRAP